MPFRPSLLALAGSLLLLAACSREQPEAEIQEPPPAASPAQPETGAAAAAVGGFTPLPSTTQVLAANSMGRSDPFASDRPVAAPRPSAAATTPPAGASGSTPPRPAPLQLPPDFLFSGVIRVGASPRAMVQYPCLPNGPCNSGSVGIGELGGRNTDLLPPGWRVASIDVNRGRLVLRQGGQTVTAEL